MPGAAAAGTGAGLGLAIADRICRTLGHALDVRSEVGAGSVFSVTAQRCEQTPAPPVERRRNVGFSRTLRVLCVDDEPQVLEGLKSLLQRWELEVGTASSAEEASKQGFEWDVVLADYQLGPGANGLDFLTAFKRRGAVIALVTANTSDAVISRAGEIGAEIIRKPVSPASLRAFLSHAAYAEATESP